jgi:hypothetical protein
MPWIECELVEYSFANLLPPQLDSLYRARYYVNALIKILIRIL